MRRKYYTYSPLPGKRVREEYGLLVVKFHDTLHTAVRH